MVHAAVRLTNGNNWSMADEASDVSKRDDMGESNIDGKTQDETECNDVTLFYISMNKKIKKKNNKNTRVLR